MKKIILIIVSLITCIFILSGCFENTPQNNKPDINNGSDKTDNNGSNTSNPSKPSQSEEEKHTHTPVLIPAVSATCTTAGFTDGYRCKECNEIYKPQVEIPALGHNKKFHSGRDATCISKGWRDYYTCTRCDYTTYTETEIGKHTFDSIGKCTVCNLTPTLEGLKYTLNSDGKSYSVDDFKHSTITDIIIPSVYNGLPVTNINYGAFTNHSQITSIVMPDSIVSIGIRAFSNCTALKTLTLSASLQEIPNGAFENCNSLENIDIPDSVTGIWIDAFDGCDNLKSVVIPASVKTISGGAFANCPNLTTVNYKGSKSQWDDIKRGYFWIRNSPNAKLYYNYN